MAKVTGVDSFKVGGGVLYATFYEDGVLVGNPKVLAMTETVVLESEIEYIESKNRESKMASTALKVAIEPSGTLKFSTYEMSAQMVAIFMSGSQREVTNEAKTDDAQVITTIARGEFVDTGNLKITTFVVQDSTDTTTYEVDIDYNIDKNTGILNLIEGGAIVDDSEIHLTVTTTEWISEIVEALKKPTVLAKLVYVEDPLVGERRRITYNKVSITATGSMALKSEEFSVLEFECEILIDQGVSPTMEVSQFYTAETIPDE